MEKLILTTAVLLAALIITTPLLTPGESETPETLTIGALPDIQAIYQNCVNNPLEEAGKTIDDPEIKHYYDDLLSDCGFDLGKATE